MSIALKIALENLADQVAKMTTVPGGAARKHLVSSAARPVLEITVPTIAPAKTAGDLAWETLVLKYAALLQAVLAAVNTALGPTVLTGAGVIHVENTQEGTVLQKPAAVKAAVQVA